MMPQNDGTGRAWAGARQMARNPRNPRPQGAVAADSRLGSGARASISSTSLAKRKLRADATA